MTEAERQGLLADIRTIIDDDNQMSRENKIKAMQFILSLLLTGNDNESANEPA